MSLILYFHPLSSFCQKVLTALYETGTPFQTHLVDLSNAEAKAAFQKIWPIAQFPVLRDEARNQTIPESSIIIEYLAQYYPGRIDLLPKNADRAIQTRLKDRFYDLHVHVQMQKIMTDRLRPAGMNDSFGVEHDKQMLKIAYRMIESEMANRMWVMGDSFTMADCAAAPALFYANMALPLAGEHPHAAAYLKRLMERPSFARVLEEAQPYMKLVPV
jgi:glutathione S-transferase